jgi:hypothetical protein
MGSFQYHLVDMDKLPLFWYSILELVLRLTSRSHMDPSNHMSSKFLGFGQNEQANF